MTTRTRLALAASIAVLACGCDQIAKHHAQSELSTEVGTRGEAARAPSEVVEVVPGYWEFQYRENPGAAFSFLADAPESIRVPFFAITTILAIGFLIFLVWKDASRWQMLGAALVIGGALGNLVDRVRLGYVVDFIHWHLGDAFDYPTFNVADIWIFVGVACLLIASFRMRKPAKTQEEAT